jgi:hypothetical protein
VSFGREGRWKGKTSSDQRRIWVSTGTKVRGKVPELANITFMVVICRGPYDNNIQTSSNQFQASYTDVRYWEELIVFGGKNCFPNEPYCLTAIYKCNLTQEELDEEYMGLYAPGQIMNAPLYGQILYNSSHSNVFKLTLGHDVKLFFLDMDEATGKDIAEHVMRPAKVIPTRHITVSCAPLLISIISLRRYPMKLKEWWMRLQVGTGLIVFIM